MRRVLVCGGVVALVAVAVSAWTTPRPVVGRSPVAVHFSDLAPAVYYQSKYRGEMVRVAYPHRLRPTADPLVWEFAPGGQNVPPTHRVHFADVPPPRPLTVVGTVEGIATDLTDRANNVPGVVVIRDARVAPATSP